MSDQLTEHEGAAGDYPDLLRGGPESEPPAATADLLAAGIGAPDTPRDQAERASILWHSNAPWVGSGYGAQSALFVPKLTSMLGYRVAFSAFYGLRGSRLGWVAADGQQFIVYPGGDNSHGNDVLGAHAKHWFREKGGMVIALTDPWVLSPIICQKLPLLAWTPIDHDPLMPRTDEWFRESLAMPIAMSHFGVRMMEDAGYENVYYVPHGFDPDVFKPADRKEARRALGIPEDAFVVGMVAANLGRPSRKSFSQAITAFGEFQKTHKDAILYLHTKLEAIDGEDLPRICKANGVRAASSDQYGLALGMPSTVVAALLSAFDVLLNPSTGEGFGIPMLEAQACGTPVITTDFSASPEVAPVSAGNWCVGGQKLWTPFESYQLTPSIDELVAAMEEAYDEAEKDREARRVSVFNWANENYRVDDVTEKYWKPVLESAELEFSWRRQLMARY